MARRTLSPAWVWLDGRFRPASQAKISIFDRGFLYGDAVFETLRCYGGLPFQWRRHERRLAASLRAFGIPRPRHDLRAAVAELQRRRRMPDAVVRITVTRGVGEGLLPPDDPVPTVLVTLRPVPPGLIEQRRTGIAAAILPFGQGRGGVAQGHKTTFYLAAVLGRRYARAQGAHEGIYIEDREEVSEATSANLFLVRRGRLETTAPSSGSLPGITRDLVLAEAERLGLRVRIGRLSVGALRDAEEVFLTNSVIEIQPVVRLDHRLVGSGTPGPLTRLLQDRYARLVERMRRDLPPGHAPRPSIRPRGTGAPRGDR